MPSPLMAIESLRHYWQSLSVAAERGGAALGRGKRKTERWKPAPTPASSRGTQVT